MKTVRDKTQPPHGRPFWMGATNETDLFYLGWGHRAYGLEPLGVTLHTGWAYVVILSGSPTLELIDRSVQLVERDILIIDPDCASGWSDQKKHTCEVLYWIWRNPPPALILPQSGKHFRTRATEEQCVHLRTNHQSCIREIRIADNSSTRQIEGLRMQLNTEIARVVLGSVRTNESEFRFQLACRWLEANVAERRAITLLRDYLAISYAELHALFMKNAGSTPAAFFQALKIQKARNLLADGRKSTKQVAFELGYAHANDLSRALHRHSRSRG